MVRADAGFIHHVAVLARSVEASLPSNHRNDLGMAVVSDEHGASAHARPAFLDAAGTIVQLVEPTGPGPRRHHLDRAGECLHHVRFGVADIDAAIERSASSDGVKAVVGGHRRGVAFLPPGPNAVHTELTEIESSRSSWRDH